MPIIPVTKIPSPVVPTFPEYTIINNAFFLFLQPSGGTLVDQFIPIHSFTDERLLTDTLKIYRENVDAVQFPMPTNGTLKSFRFFQIENDTNLTYDINFINDTKVTSTKIFTLPADTSGDLILFKNDSLTIDVNKGDLVNYEIKFPSAPSVGLDVHSLYLSFNFKPTSST